MWTDLWTLWILYCSERSNLELFDFIEPNSNSNFCHRTRTELEPNFSVIKWYFSSWRNDCQQFHGKKLKPKYKMPFWKSNFPNKNQNQEVQFFFKFYFHFLFSCLKAENVSFGYKFGSILVRWIEPYSSIEPSNLTELPGSTELELELVRFDRSLQICELKIFLGQKLGYCNCPSVVEQHKKRL